MRFSSCFSIFAAPRDRRAASSARSAARPRSAELGSAARTSGDAGGPSNRPSSKARTYSPVPPHDDRGLAARREVRDRRVGELDEPRRGHLLVGLHDIEQVVRDARALVGGDLAGADVHPDVDLLRVSTR